MITQLFRRQKQLTFERTYSAPIGQVWEAWTRPELLRQWWGPEDTTIVECEIELRVGGRLYIVMEAGEGMGKYEGTRWPLEGTFTHIEAQRRLTYDARSWTEGEDASYIEHINDLELSEDRGKTRISLSISVNKIGPGVKAKLAAFGMKWGYKAQLDKLESFLAG